MTANTTTAREAIGSIGLCGCGLGTKYEIIRSLLLRAKNREGFYSPMPPHFSAEGVEVMAHFLDRFGLLEHGSSVTSAWLSPTGGMVLDYLETFGTDEKQWPEEAA